MQKIFTILILLLSSFKSFLCSPDYDFEFERVEATKGVEKTVVDYSTIRLTRLRRGENYVANGYVIYNEPVGEDVMHEIKTTYSPTGTSQFRAHPYTVQKSTACEFFKTFYREYGQPWIEGHSNFSYIPEEGLCPLPKGNFYVKDMSFDEEKLPNHAPRGFWKFEQVFEQDGKSIGGLVMYAKITDKV